MCIFVWDKTIEKKKKKVNVKGAALLPFLFVCLFCACLGRSHALFCFSFFPSVSLLFK